MALNREHVTVRIDHGVKRRLDSFIEGISFQPSRTAVVERALVEFLDRQEPHHEPHHPHKVMEVA